MKKILLLIILALGFVGLTGCLPQAVEEEFNIVFVNEGEIIATGKINQFTNIKTPTIAEGYIPYGYKFLGWTPYDLDEIDTSSVEAFKKMYIGAGKMLHYSDVKGFEDNFTVVMQALMMDSEDIPKEYHYVVIAWYDKEATSGITSAEIQEMTSKLNAYLRSVDVSEEDLATVVIRGYSGNVGPSVGQIMADEDVDIMLGWGSASNVTSTGGMPESMLLESVSYPVIYNGETKNRTLHRLTDTDACKLVLAWLQSEECTKIFNGE